LKKTGPSSRAGLNIIKMSFLSASISITRYIVEGRLEAPVLETVSAGLKKNAISEIDDQSSEKAAGWTSFEKPYQPDFSGSSFAYGAYLVFSLRIDKKSIPSKVVKKHFMLESARRLADSGRQYLSRNEKQTIKDHVINRLNIQVPATPNVYDIIWNYEDSCLWFFSNLKAANEELETLFLKSFDLTLVRMIPYTAAHLASGLTDAEKDILLKLSPTSFTG
jgi:recombination associated protein RdgC